MAYDDGLADRIRDLVAERRGVTEKKMFGGLAFLDQGRMFVGIIGSRLMARVGPERYADALKRAHVGPMDFTGKPMKGYVYVEPDAYAADEALERWVAECLAFARTLPPK